MINVSEISVTLGFHDTFSIINSKQYVLDNEILCLKLDFSLTYEQKTMLNNIQKNIGWDGFGFSGK